MESAGVVAAEVNFVSVVVDGEGDGTAAARGDGGAVDVVDEGDALRHAADSRSRSGWGDDVGSRRSAVNAPGTPCGRVAVDYLYYKNQLICSTIIWWHRLVGLKARTSMESITRMRCMR